MGWNNQPTKQVIFENVRVPISNRLREEGFGFKIAMKVLVGLTSVAYLQTLRSQNMQDAMCRVCS